MVVNYNELYALAKEVDDGVSEVEEVAASAANQQHRETIAGQLGTVVVSGAGELRSVELNVSRLQTTNGRALGKSITETINNAEAAARNALNEKLIHEQSKIPSDSAQY